MDTDFGPGHVCMTSAKMTQAERLTRIETMEAAQ